MDLTPDTTGGMSALLDRLGTSDPRLQPLVELLRQNAAAREVADGKAALKRETAERIERAVRRSAELEEENAFLRRRLALLASAVGACPDCWGEEPECPCGGGAPGTYAPAREAFDAYVLPAVRALGARARRAAGPVRHTEQRSTGRPE